MWMKEKRELMVPADSEPDPDFNTALTYEDMNNMADVLVDNSTDETKIIRAVHTIRHKLSGTQLLAFLENESGFQQKIDNLIDEYMDKVEGFTKQDAGEKADISFDIRKYT